MKYKGKCSSMHHIYKGVKNRLNCRDRFEGMHGVGDYFSRNISKTLNIPFLCFSPFSSYFRTENCSMRELRREGNAELSNVEF